MRFEKVPLLGRLKHGPCRPRKKEPVLDPVRKAVVIAHRIRPDAKDDRDVSPFFRHERPVIGPLPEGHEDIRFFLLHILFQRTDPAEELSDAALLLLVFLEPYHKTLHPAVGRKFVFPDPFRGDMYFMPFIDKRIGEVCHHPLRAALFQAV